MPPITLHMVLARQIALDLHDEVGSGLAQIAILSEVGRRDATPATASLLAESAELARGLRSAMADIVWAVDPRQDRLVDLVRRMRQTAFNLLEADSLAVDFQAPPDGDLERVGLAPDRKRHLLLVFKETLTNVARHAAATRVDVALQLADGTLELEVRDDGCGFDPAARYAGHGLGSLRQRAAEMGAALSIDSAAGRGTTVRLRVPQARPRR